MSLHKISDLKPVSLSPGLTVFVPLYNEEVILETNTLKLIEYLGNLDTPYEIFLGSNGSTDDTQKIGKRLEARHRQVVFFHLPFRGPGLAFAEALKRARYTMLACQDADLSVELDFLGRASAALQKYDAVIGAKKESQSRPFLRILVSEFFIFCTNLLLGLPYRDYSIGAKAYRTHAIRPFIEQIDRHTFYTQELIYRLQKSSGRIIEIPVQCNDWRKTRFNLFHEGIYRFSKLFGLWMRQRLKDRT